MSDKAVILPKWSPNGRIILAKGQLDHSYTFWTMPIMIFSPVYFFFGTPSISMVARIYLQWSQSWDCTYRWYLCSYFPSFVDLLALTEKVFTYQESYLAHLSNLGNGAWSCLVSLPFFLRPQRGPVARKGVRRAVGTGVNCPRTLPPHHLPDFGIL